MNCLYLSWLIRCTNRSWMTRCVQCKDFNRIFLFHSNRWKCLNEVSTTSICWWKTIVGGCPGLEWHILHKIHVWKKGSSEKKQCRFQCLPLGAHLQMTEFHHKLGFKPFVITSQVIIKVSSTSTSSSTSSSTTPRSQGTSRFQSIKVGDQRFHDISIQHLLDSTWSLNCCWMTFPTNI